MTIEPVSVILNGVGMGMKTQPQVYEDRARKDAGRAKCEFQHCEGAPFNHSCWYWF
ncbi:hypothetical protein BDA96_10G213200 [Sorghum bicolor]|uniref:Uncharacterized protein n=1 Tax=Sorghum bicolor TaxID=4558 RepID=A0A921Q4F1_SORBI|nr:hypothetical protein BDA96_10G213200 [Sorghum bicolor]